MRSLNLLDYVIFTERLSGNDVIGYESNRFRFVLIDGLNICTFRLMLFFSILLFNFADYVYPTFGLIFNVL